VPREIVAAGIRPGQLLNDYMQNRPSSELFRALTAARELREAVDAVAVVCRGPLGHALQGLFDTCCHPFHNALSRGERGGRPRLYFDVGHPEPDRTAGLLDLVEAARGNDLLHCWGLAWLASTDDDGFPNDSSQVAGYAAHFAGLIPGGPPPTQPPQWGKPRPTVLHRVAQGPGAEVFHPAVLSTAAVAGIDVVRFLGGGVAMLQRFTEAPAEVNPPLLLAAGMQAAAASPQPSRLSLDVNQAPAAAALGRWWASHDGSDRVPPSMQHVCRLTVVEPRRGPLASEPQPTPSERAAVAFPHPLTIELPRLDEHTIGQLLALRLIALRIVAHRKNEA
jgi:glucose-6-phosphate isomerase